MKFDNPNREVRQKYFATRIYEPEDWQKIRKAGKLSYILSFTLIFGIAASALKIAGDAVLQFIIGNNVWEYFSSMNLIYSATVYPLLFFAFGAGIAFLIWKLHERKILKDQTADEFDIHLN